MTVFLVGFHRFPFVFLYEGRPTIPPPPTVFHFLPSDKKYEFFRDIRQATLHGFALQTDRGGDLMVWHVRVGAATRAAAAAPVDSFHRLFWGQHTRRERGVVLARG